MENDFYKYPLQFSKLFKIDDLQRCGLGESISQNLQLIITSHYGEHRYNPVYGCEIWEMDFDLIMSLKVWEEKLRKSLERAILENEKRIEKADIEVKISEVERKFDAAKLASIKRKVDIYMRASIVSTGESFRFHTDLFLSPISYN